jgi:hypothetical protein
MTNTENATPESISDSANKTASARLSAHELNQLEEIAARSKLTVSAFIRELILAKIQKEKGSPKADILLTEIVGIRLLLMNILGPLACEQELMTKQRVEAIVAEIKKVKHRVALQIQNGENAQ